MKKIALIVLALAVMASLSFAKDKAPKAEKIAGWVADAKCAAAKGNHADHAACAKKCIEGGEKAVLVTDKDNKVLNIENADAVKGHEGEHVTVTGTVNGDTVHVNKVAVMKTKATKQKGEHGM